MLMMRVRGRALRVVSKLVLLAMLVAALTVALVPVALADGHLQAADGQSLNDQPPDVQALYRSVYGAGAAARWVEDHNAAIGEMGMDAPPAMTDLYLTVRHVAWQRSGDAELAARIAADVMARGTAEAFLAGTDTGVVWGVWTEPEPMGMGMGMGSSSSSSSTSSGPAAPKSPSTSEVSDWDDLTRNWLTGEKVSLTLPSSSHPDVTTYNLVDDGDLPTGLTFDADKRTVSGTPSAATTTSFTKDYAAQDSGGNIGEPYILSLTINIRDQDVQPSFRSASVSPISVVEGESIARTELPEAIGGNPDVEYSISGLPAGLTFTPASRVLEGMPDADAMFKAYTVTYTATDQDEDTASLTFTITIEEDTAPMAPSIDNMEFTEGDVIRITLPVGSDGNGALTYTLTDTQSVTGLDFVARTRLLHGTVSAPASAAVTTELTYTVLDADANSDASDTGTTTFTIKVTAK